MPMVSIGAHLHRLGHEVLVLTGQRHRRLIEDRGLRCKSFDVPDYSYQLPDPARHRLLPGLIRRYLTGREEMESLFIAPLAAQFEALTAVLAEHTIDAIVVDVAFTGAVPFALTRDCPVLVCGVGPLTISSVDTPPFGVAWHPRRGVSYGAMNRAVQRWLLKGSQQRLDAALLSMNAPRCPVPLLDWPLLADRMLQLTIPAFEYPRRDLAAAVQFVGPVFPSAATEFVLPDWWDAVLGDRTVVHVTQGTLDNGDVDQLLGPTVRALADQDVVVIGTTGRGDGRGVGVSACNAHITDWIPYSELMPHVDVMITNGGYGGVQYALRHGVPLIVAGETSDKAEVAARVAYSGAGINLRSARPRPADIVAAVRKITRDGRYRAAAQRLGGVMAQTDALNAIAEAVSEAASGARGGGPDVVMSTKARVIDAL
jgi:UDP:flavonoid glycosyltransferase YjiC (YdhE family)